ncbi:hypothetical protein L0244_08275 [bacterium]|nr:hypothetical protein [bacterium]MCI0612972.1 hypothetical protein [bacterium]
MKYALIFFAFIILMAPAKRAENAATDPTQNKSEYADVLALEGTAKQEILAIARILRAKSEMAIDRTAAANEYCLNSGSGTMVHFANDLDATKEDIVYEFDASGLIKAGLDTNLLATLPPLGKMEPGKWYFLPQGTDDPHHKHKMASPIIAIAIDVK